MGILQNNITTSKSLFRLMVDLNYSIETNRLRGSLGRRYKFNAINDATVLGKFWCENTSSLIDQIPYQIFITASVVFFLNVIL